MPENSSDRPLCSFCDNPASWQCETCDDWFCQLHTHTTDKGKDVECAGCEYNRPDYENDYPRGE